MPAIQAPPPSRKDRGQYLNHLNPAEARTAGVRYVVAPVQTDEIDFYARGVLITIMGKPANFQWSKPRLRAETKIPMRLLNRAIAALRKHGYLRITPRKYGRDFTGHLWEATFTPNQWSLQPAQNETSHGEIHSGDLHGVSRNIRSEGYNHSLTLSESGEGLEHLSPGESSESPKAEVEVETDIPDAGVRDAGVRDAGVRDVDSDADSRSPMLSVGEFKPDMLHPPCNWGVNPDKVYNWVLHNHYAELFRTILGPGHRWDRSSARMFARKFARGGITPLEIYAVRQMGKAEIQQACAACVTSLHHLAKHWRKMVDKMAGDREGVWHWYCLNIFDENQLGSTSVAPPTPEMWELQRTRANLLELNEYRRFHVLETLLYMPDDEWFTEQLHIAETSEKFWDNIKNITSRNCRAVPSFHD